MKFIFLISISSILLSNYLVISQGVLPEEVIEQEIPRDGKKFKTMFGSQSLQCVTCQKMVEEFEWAIEEVDPKKKIESGIWDLEGKKKKIVSLKITKMSTLKVVAIRRLSITNYMIYCTLFLDRLRIKDPKSISMI